MAQTPVIHEMAEVELALHPDFGERQSLTTQLELYRLILA